MAWDTCRFALCSPFRRFTIRLLHLPVAAAAGADTWLVEALGEDGCAAELCAAALAAWEGVALELAAAAGGGGEPALLEPWLASFATGGEGSG